MLASSSSKSMAPTAWAFSNCAAGTMMRTSCYPHIGMTPFYANYGYHPWMIVAVDDSPILAAHYLLENVMYSHKVAKASIQQVQEKQIFYATKHRLSAPDFKPGDMVWLCRTHIKLDRASSKMRRRSGQLRRRLPAKRSRLPHLLGTGS